MSATEAGSLRRLPLPGGIVRAGGIRFVLLLFAFVLCAQLAELTHAHDGLNFQTDCHLCLKLGSSGKAVAAAPPEFDSSQQGLPDTFLDGFVPQRVIPAHRSRGPPV